MERLTDRKRAQTLKDNAEKLEAAGFAVESSHAIYIRLAEYEDREQLVTDQKNKCRQILDHYGEQKQRRQLVEECAELIQALTKMERAGEQYPSNELHSAILAVREEIADVEIMLEQIKNVLPTNCETEIKRIIDYKLNRQLERMQESENTEKVQEHIHLSEERRKELYKDWKQGKDGF